MKLRTVLSPRLWLRIYCLVLLGYFPLASLTGDWLPPVVFVGQFRPVLLLGAGVAALIAIMMRRRAAAFLLAAGFIVGLWLYRQPLLEVCFVGLSQEPESPSADLVVESWNVGLHRSDPQDILAHFRTSDARVLALQEFMPGHEELFRKELATLFPHQIYRGSGRSSMALLSRTELIDTVWHEPEYGKPWFVTQIDVAGRRLRVINVHSSAFLGLLSRWWPDHANFMQICEETEADIPTVLMGDFNVTETSSEYAGFIDAGWRNAFEEVGEGFGFTFPVFGSYRGIPSPPILRIDHIWTLGDIEATRCEVGPESSSDHLPLLARLRFTEH